MEQINITFTAIEKETEAAVLVKFENRTEWMPKSQISIEGNTITMPSWLASKKHLVETAAARRTDRMFANMKTEVEAGRKAMTEDQKREYDEITLHNQIYCHYDKRSREYYAIDVNGKRHNA